MKVYIDLILFINFMYDFIILTILSSILKRRATLLRLFTGSLIGSLTIFILFIPMNSNMLFLSKVLISLLLSLITFGYKDIKYFIYNILTFYLLSIILGGLIYYLNVELSYTNIGMVFYHKGININYILVLLLSPLSLLLYKREVKKIKEINGYYYKVDVYIKNKIIKLNAFLDSANTLRDPITKKYVIISSSKKLKEYDSFYLVPYETVNQTGILKCIKVNKIYIEGIGFKNNVLIGLTNKKLKSNGVDTLLNYSLLKGE